MRVFTLTKVEDLIQRSFWKEGGGVMEPCQEPGTVGDPTVAAATATEAFPCQVSQGGMTKILEPTRYAPFVDRNTSSINVLMPMLKRFTIGRHRYEL